MRMVSHTKLKDEETGKRKKLILLYGKSHEIYVKIDKNRVLILIC